MSSEFYLKFSINYNFLFKLIVDILLKKIGGVFTYTSYLTFHKKSRIVKSILVSVNACVQYTYIYIKTYTCIHTCTEYSFLNTGMTRKKGILPRALQKAISIERFFCDSAGCSTKAFDMHTYMVFWACGKYTAE